ncbi:MAG: hypothetical protein MUF40_07875, partial [Gemmatimonadaceae bacterium]|nr:hypothetical protein [Gemmatimonadaceae bacterium]
PAIGAIRVAPSNPDIVYVGTGSDGLRSNIITGKGVYRSSDAGRSWTFLGLEESGHVGAIEVHPTNPNVAFVAAIGQAFSKNRERGLYRTTDGGATWTNVLFVSDSTGAVDVEFKPDDPTTLYAAMWRAERKPWTIISGAMDEGGVWKSTDGGTSWRRLQGGLPTGLIGKIDLAVSPAAPNRVYALVEAPRPKGGLYRSDDAGATWTLVNTTAGLLARPFYYTNVDADPTNADVVYVNNESFFKSTDGGKSFTVLSTPHGDNHDMWINPDEPDIWVQSNDGGANVTLDGGRTWSTQYNQGTSEHYTVAVDDRWPYRVYGPQQDQGPTLIIPSLPVNAIGVDEPSQYWQQGPGCETGPAVPSPWDRNVVYGACKGQFSRFHLGTGQEINSWVGAQSMYGHDPKDLIHRFQRVAPLTTSPHVKGTIYHASQFVMRSRDEGTTWERISPDLTAFDPATQGISGQPITRDITGEEFHSTIYALEESPLEPGVLIAGANDGPVSITRDGGKTWKRVTPPMPPGGRVQSVEGRRPGARPARGSRPQGAPLPRHRVRALREPRRRRDLAAVPGRSPARAGHRHRGAPQGSRARHDGARLLDPRRPLAGAAARRQRDAQARAPLRAAAGDPLAPSGRAAAPRLARVSGRRRDDRPLVRRRADDGADHRAPRRARAAGATSRRHAHRDAGRRAGDASPARRRRAAGLPRTAGARARALGPAARRAGRRRPRADGRPRPLHRAPARRRRHAQPPARGAGRSAPRAGRAHRRAPRRAGEARPRGP